MQIAHIFIKGNVHYTHMAKSIHVTVPDDQREFLEQHGLSPSKLLQSKIQEKQELFAPIEVKE